MTKRAALILAGGKGRRFQSKNAPWEDKALAELSGKPLLIHAVDNVQDVVDEIAISVNDEERKAKYAQVLKKHGFTNIAIVVDDRGSRVRGPNVAIMSGLKSIHSDYCLTVPCDMPFLQPSVADYLFHEAEGFEVVTPMWPNGRLETLIMILERQINFEIAETLCKLNRPRSDDIPRGASKILFASPINHIKMLDSDLKSFININSKEDLLRLQTRYSSGSATKDLPVKLADFSTSDLRLLRDGAEFFQNDKFSEAKSIFASCASNFEASKCFFWAAVSGESHGEALLKMARQLEPEAASKIEAEAKEAYLKAAKNYQAEAKIHEQNRCMLLAERALADKAWCESWALGKQSHTHRYPSKVS